MYRGEDGLKCGIGFCIPDENYSSDLEEQNASDITHYIPKEYYHDLKFLNSLQAIHDASEVEEWVDDFMLFARTYDLKCSALLGNPPENQ